MRLTVTTDTARIIASLERKLEAARARIRTLEKALNIRGAKPPRHVDTIVNHVAAKKSIPASAILGRSRLKPVAEARQECYALSRQLGLSLPQIGTAFGKDHTTILAGIRAHEARVAKQSVSG